MKMMLYVLALAVAVTFFVSFSSEDPMHGVEAVAAHDVPVVTAPAQ